MLRLSCGQMYMFNTAIFCLGEASCGKLFKCLFNTLKKESVVLFCGLKCCVAGRAVFLGFLVLLFNFFGQVVV